MGCSQSRAGGATPRRRDATEPTTVQPYPLDGRIFTDIMMRFMMKNPEGPTMDQGALLQFIRNQATPADRGDSRFNKTPVQYASQHRLVKWLMFIIHRLNVSQPRLLSDAINKMNVVDRRLRSQLNEDEQRIYDQVMKLLIAPNTATFLDGDYQTEDEINQELKDAYNELWQTVPDAPDIPDEPPQLGAWMMARTVSELTIEAYSGGLWGLFTSCLKLAEIVKRWTARSQERLAWRAFAEAHRGMVESARTLNTMADDINIGLNVTMSSKIKKSLKTWIGSVQLVVESLCKGIEAAIANPRTNSDDLNRLMVKSTAEVMEKRALMNVEFEHARQQCSNNERIDKLEKAVARFHKLDKDLAESLGILSDTETPQHQIDEALERVLRKYRFSRGKGGGNDADGPAPGPAAGP
eukprot:g5074.t1